MILLVKILILLMLLALVWHLGGMLFAFILAVALGFFGSMSIGDVLWAFYRPETYEKAIPLWAVFAIAVACIAVVVLLVLWHPYWAIPGAVIGIVWFLIVAVRSKFSAT